MSATSLEVCAIDGPSGAGKSTIAKAAAYELGWAHLDTGSMYRAVTLFLLDAGVAIDDQAAVSASLESIDLRVGGSGRVWLDDKEVTGRLRIRAVEAQVSAVSAIPRVRERMRHLQRAQAEHGPLVAEGRDMTSVVFPDARYKFYIDADPHERARRRLADFVAAGRETPSFEKVLEEIQARDHFDSTREDSPLRRVEGADYIDSTDMSFQDVLARILTAIREGAS